MTYGEAHIAELNSICLVDGVWTKTLHIENKPKPMNRKDAARYYNTKLFAYWMDQLDDRISIIKKSQIISALMFGHTETYKLFKEKPCG